MGVPNFDGGVAGGGNERPSAATDDDVVDPIRMMFHRLNVRVLSAMSVPYSNDAITPCYNVEIGGDIDGWSRMDDTIQCALAIDAMLIYDR